MVLNLGLILIDSYSFKEEIAVTWSQEGYRRVWINSFYANVLLFKIYYLTKNSIEWCLSNLAILLTNLHAQSSRFESILNIKKRLLTSASRIPLNTP